MVSELIILNKFMPLSDDESDAADSGNMDAGDDEDLDSDETDAKDEDLDEEKEDFDGTESNE